MKFRRQQPIGPYIVDFFSAQYRLAIELDGAAHAAQRDQDAARDAELETKGIRVLHVSADAVETQIDAVMAQIDAALGSLAPVRGPSPRQLASQPAEDDWPSGPAPR